jgi:CelD/BcsL family acetyltransferase involved in cellulose biosynthesis
MRQIIIDPTTDPVWGQLTAGSAGSLFTSALWLRALKNTYGFTFAATVLEDDAGTPVSGVAWVDVHDLRGRRVVALPFCDYADPVIGDPAHWAVLRSALTQHGVPVRARTLRPDGYAEDDAFVHGRETRWHGIDLTREPATMWDSIDQSARRAIRKAEKSGVVVRRAEHLDDVRRFYDLHCSIRRYKYHMLTQPFALMEHLWEEFSATDRFHLLLAEVDGETVGGTLYLEWDDTLYYKFNASQTDGLAVRPNDLLVWAGMQLGHERGLAAFDFGQSDLDQEGLLRYKEKYATSQATIRLYLHDPAGWTDAGAALGGATLGQLTALLVAEGVPAQAYQQAGDLLYRNFC